MQQHQDIKLEIASRLLSGIITQDRNRQIEDRLGDIDHSLELADELIRRSACQSPPSCEHTLGPKLDAQPTVKTREQVIEREPGPFSDLLQTKRGTSSSARPSKGPTLH